MKTPLTQEDHYREFQKYRKMILKTSPISEYNLAFMPYQYEAMDNIEKAYWKAALKEKSCNN